MKKEQCSLRPATEERQLMEVEAELLQMWREGAHCTGVAFNEEKQDQMHPTIKEEVVAEGEDTNDGENIFVQKKEGVVEQDQMHATIGEEVVTDEEDTDDGENIFVQKKEGGVVDSNWVLLDSQSTVDQVSNPARGSTGQVPASLFGIEKNGLTFHVTRCFDPRKGRFLPPPPLTMVLPPPPI